MPQLRNCFTLLLIILLPLSVIAQDSHDFYLYEDSSGDISSTQAFDLFKSGKFQKQDGNSFNPGFTRSVYWLAYPNQVVTNHDSLLLHIGDHHINRIHFYEASDSNTRQLFETGDYYPYSQRPLKVPGFYFPVRDKAVYLAKIDKSNESLQLVYWITNVNDAMVAEGNNAIVIGLLTGMMCIMLLFGLYLFIITREQIYFYYIAYLLSGWLWVLANSGHGFAYIWGDLPAFASKARPVFAVIAGALSMLFMVSFVGAGPGIKKVVMWVNGSMWIYVAIIMSFNSTGYQSPWWMYIQYLIPVTTLLYVCLAFYFLVKKSVTGNRYAQFYLAGALVLMGTAIMQAIIQLGNFSELQYFFSHFGLATGYVAETVIITAGMVYRFNQYRIDKLKLLLEMNRQQQENTRIMMEVQETERSQVANQLHDVAGSLLSAARINLSSLREKVLIEGEAGIHAEKAEEAVVMVSDMVRNLSHALSPVMMEKVGFKTSIEKIVNIFNASGKIKIELLVNGFEKYIPGMNKYYTALYSIIYELLNNMVKHSAAHHAWVQLTEHDDCFTLVAEDDGVGIDEYPAQKKSIGISGIQSKINYFGGKIAFDKNIPTGLIVTIEIPLTTHED